MTCIVAAVKGDDVFMAADSAWTRGWEQRSIAGSKIYTANGRMTSEGSMLVGVSGSPRIYGLLKSAEIPERENAKLEFNYINDAVIPLWHKKLKDANVLISTEQDNESFGGQLLVGYRSRLFLIESNFAVMEFAYPYMAIGSGCEVALGVLHATEEVKDRYDVQTRLLKALRAAVEFGSGVRPPYTVVSTSKFAARFDS